MTTIQTGNSTKNQCNVASVISVSASDYILTPLSCASLVNEVLKNLLYQRSQIPYPYAWLKNIVTKKRQSLEGQGEDKKQNFTLNRHYKVVSTAYDSVESVMCSIVNLFVSYGSRLKEIIIVVGVTPVCPKEIFSIKVISMANGHVERNHVVENSKKQAKVLRNIFLEDVWMNLVENTLVCSNTYIFLKLNTSTYKTEWDPEGVFIPSKPPSFPPRVKHTVINLFSSSSHTFLCCDKLEVFNDSCEISSPRKVCDSTEQNKNHDEEVWLQSKVLIQGFKDCFINKVSACELW